MSVVVLLAAAALSIGAMTAIDRACFRWAVEHAPALVWIPDFRLTSLAAVAVAALLVVERSAWRAPQRRLPRALFVASGCWLLLVATFTFATRWWTFVPSSAADFLAFLITGLLVEELLFRGVIFDLAKRTLAGDSTARVPRWVWFSAAVFALSHLQFHGFEPSAAALTQVTYTLPIGVLLGLLRERSGSLWVPIALHVANNVITLGR
jgi:membrane protease YdiL (CAAX protease family)